MLRKLRTRPNQSGGTISVDRLLAKWAIRDADMQDSDDKPQPAYRSRTGRIRERIDGLSLTKLALLYHAHRLQTPETSAEFCWVTCCHSRCPQSAHRR
jgi:hypothetical protein